MQAKSQVQPCWHAKTQGKLALSHSWVQQSFEQKRQDVAHPPPAPPFPPLEPLLALLDDAAPPPVAPLELETATVPPAPPGPDVPLLLLKPPTPTVTPAPLELAVSPTNPSGPNWSKSWVQAACIARPAPRTAMARIADLFMARSYQLSAIDFQLLLPSPAAKRGVGRGPQLIADS